MEAAPIRYLAELLDVGTHCDLLFALPNHSHHADVRRVSRR
jgi:hypothetical protein